jgi:hypothetical protein
MRMRLLTLLLAVMAVLLALNLPLASGFVNPVRGGAQRSNADAPMIMPKITFDGNNIQVVTSTGADWQTLTGSDMPVMWPLQGNDKFDPAAFWYSALDGKAYNWQYGWTVAAATMPDNGWIWIELQSQTDGLKAYDRYQNSYTQIFQNSGDRWKWNPNQNMAHNAYAVTPVYGTWTATYTVYIGDASSGAHLAVFNSDTITLSWASGPEPTTMTILALGAAYLFNGRRKGRKD